MSLNTVAVRLGLEVGPKNVVRTAHRLGISSKLEANASIALGTSEVSVIELVGAYAPFANGGLGVSPHVVTKIRTKEGKAALCAASRAARPGDRAAPCRDDEHHDAGDAAVSGTARKAEIPGWTAAGKTGTSQDFRDAWFIGYTANLVTGVWLGNDDNSPTKKATGGGLPVEVWTRFMRSAHQGVPVAGLPNSQRGGFLSNLFQTASQVSAPPAPSRADPARRRISAAAGTNVRAAAQSVGTPGSGGRTGWLADGPVVRTVKHHCAALADQRRTSSWQRRPAFPLKRAGTNPRRRRSRVGCIRTRPDGRWSWVSWCRE